MTGPHARRPIRRALISVYDKTGLQQLARGLHDAGVDIVSTGSTAKTIAGSGVPVTPVEEVTGFPEILDGRVKTLHPRVHAGLLADTRKPEHAAALDKLDIAPFDLVVVNLYPFSETVESGADVDECVEQIDIGGPAMVRAAAKNHPSVAVVTDPLGYDGVLAAVRSGGFTLAERKRLASLAFRHTAEYDVAVAGYEMHIGRTIGFGTQRPLLQLDDGRFDGAISADGRVAGSYLHGFFGGDAQRAAWLARLGAPSSSLAYEALVEQTLDALAAHLAAHIDTDKMLSLAR